MVTSFPNPAEDCRVPWFLSRDKGVRDMPESPWSVPRECLGSIGNPTFTRVQNSFRAWRLGQEKTLSPRRWGSPKPFERGQNRGLRCILKVFESSKPTCAVLDSIVTFTETWFWTRQRDIHDKRLNPSKTSFQRCFGQQCHHLAHGEGTCEKTPKSFSPQRRGDAETRRRGDIKAKGLFSASPRLCGKGGEGSS